MHVHLKGRSPCSIMSAENLYNNLSQRFDGICITDHGILKPIKNLPFQEISVFFGVEITCDRGDLLAYGINSLPPKNYKAKEIIDFIHAQGGVAVCAHPFSSRNNDFDNDVYDFDFDAIEVNGSLTLNANKSARKAAKIMDLPTIGGSDAHSIKQLNTFGTRFSVPIRTMADIVRAIKDGNCWPIKI